MFRFFTHWIIVLLLFLLSSMVWAEFSAIVGFDRYEISDSEAEILGVFTDSRGFIWLNTESGAFRFDGREFLHIKKELAGTYVMDISEAPDGVLWFATSGGITSLNTSAWEFTQYYHDPENPDSLGHSFVNDLHFDLKGRLWIAHDGGIDLMNTQTGKISHFGQNPENNANLQEGPWPGKIIEDEKGNFWVGYQNPVYIDRFNPETGTFSRFDYRHPNNYIPNGYIRDLRSGNGKLWVATTKDTGLYLIDLDSEKVTHYQHNSGDLSSIGAVNIYQSFIDRTGKVWLATDGGLDLLSADTGEFLHIPPDSDDKLKMKAPPRGITEDLSGNLWIVSLEGLYRTSLNNYMFQTIPTSLFVTGHLAEPAGGFWVTTLEEGPLHFDKNLSLSKQYQKDQSSWGMTYDNAGIPWGMAYDEAGMPWTSIVGQGPHQYDPQTDSFKLVPFGEYSEELKWAIVTNDSSGGLWFLSLTRAFQYKNNVLKLLTYKETDPDSGEKVQKEFIAWTVKNIFVDSKERTWIGTSIGLYKVGRHQQGLSVYKADPLKEGTISNAQITGIVQSKNEDVWISTMQGLNRYLPETDTFEIVDTDDGLPSDGITSMAADESGILWLGTGGGIIRFDPASWDISVFGPEHGAFIEEGIVTGSFGSDGRIYMGGPIGITRFDPAEIRKSTFTPPVQLLSLQLTDSQEGSLSRQTAPNELNLPWTNESFTLEFSAMDLTKPESVKYRIRLDGWDNDWSELGNDNSIRYTNIPGGSYEFLVDATNADGVWTAEDKWARMNIHIATHPLRTPGAVISYILLGFALITGIFMRYRAMQRKKLLQEQFISDRLRNVDRLKDEFLANTTHELRTPLNGIIGIAESLIDETGETVSSGTKKELSLIASSGRRLSCLINDILDFSRLKKGDIEIQKDRVDISRLVNTVLVLSRPLCSGKSLELINDVPADLPAAVGDVNRIQQIFHNLVGNAIKFTPEGSVTVSAGIDRKEFIEITVSDTGPGIPIAKQEEIWLSFRQADASSSRDASGTGLGLPITRKLVELHGGSIRLESDGGKGASFIFTLPVAVDAAAAADLRTVASVRALPGNSPEIGGTVVDSSLPPVNLPLILYVDDEAINRHVVEQQLKESPYTLSLASTGDGALNQIEKGRRPELILLDIMMPGMDGYQVCRSIRQKYSPNDLPIIMVTAKNQVADLVEGLSAGANDFISKPCSREELLARIDRHIDVARTHAFYGRFVPKDILGLLEKSGADSPESGNHIEKRMTLLLADFAGNPLIKQSETFAFLSSFLPKVLPVIRENQGIIHRYEGEGVISFFPESSSKALESSIEIQRLTAGYNTEHHLRGKRAIEIDTVLHSGRFIIGTAGDDEFTGEVVLSDAVKQTVYLRDLARRFSAPVLATEPVTLEMKGDFCKRLVTFLNHDSNCGVYEILAGGRRDMDLKIRSLEDFERGIQLFYGSRFDEASVEFGKVLKLNPQDMAAVLHRNRCAYYLTNEPDKKPEILI